MGGCGLRPLGGRGPLDVFLVLSDGLGPLGGRGLPGVVLRFPILGDTSIEFESSGLLVIDISTEPVGDRGPVVAVFSGELGGVRGYLVIDTSIFSGELGTRNERDELSSNSSESST